MEEKKKKEYSKPAFTVFRIGTGQALLTMSSNSVGLTGSGVNESDGDDNGDQTW